MNKDVLITIHSIQNIDGRDCDGPELITQGTYDYAPDGVRLSYMESELTGLGGTRTDLHIKPEEVVLSRRGSVNAQMVFRRGEKQRFRYETNFGSLSLGVSTQRLETALDEHGFVREGASILGTMSYFPPIMGQMLAGYVIRKLAGLE